MGLSVHMCMLGVTVQVVLQHYTTYVSQSSPFLVTIHFKPNVQNMSGNYTDVNHSVRWTNCHHVYVIA